MALDGLRVGVRFVIENRDMFVVVSGPDEIGSQDKARVEYSMCVYLSWKRTSIDGNKRAPLFKHPEI